MSFNSLDFLIFLPVVTLLYFLIPKKIRYIWLLVVSYFFYMCWNAQYVLLLLFSTVITYLCGILMEWAKRGKWNANKIVICKKIILLIGLLCNLAVLFFFKYFEFALCNISMVLDCMGISFNSPKFDVLLPVGISFYIFQTLGYAIDIYRDDTKCEKNFFKYALFVSFFPQLVAGPIERSKNLLRQISRPTCFNVDNARYGLLTMAYGFILKLVIADRISVIIDPILSDYQTYNGTIIFICIVLFAIQIYCDFHGYTQIAIGSAKILGYNLQQNFNAPYFALDIKDFWRRWHISLTTWFTDYLYIPLGGNRKGKVRKNLNVIIVFLCSGLWHGASWTYIIWGGINGLYLVAYDFLKPFTDKIIKNLNIDINSLGWKVVTRLFTFILVDYTWLFFRAEDIHTALGLQCPTARSGRHQTHFKFGAFAFLTVQYSSRPQIYSGSAAYCRSLV